jgi:CheY-like chemotaxis protein
MDANAVTLTLGVFGLVLGLVIVLAVAYLGRRPGAKVGATANLGPLGQFGFNVEQLARDMDEAVEARKARGAERGSDEAKKRLAESLGIRPARVLWVDDDPDNNLLEVSTLLHMGLSVVQATSTAAALRYEERMHFDLVITDLTRDRDGGQTAGVEFIRELRARGFLRPVFVYAGDIEARRELAAAAGAAVVTTAPGVLFDAVLQHVAEPAIPRPT